MAGLKSLTVQSVSLRCCPIIIHIATQLTIKIFPCAVSKMARLAVARPILLQVLHDLCRAKLNSGNQCPLWQAQTMNSTSDITQRGIIEKLKALRLLPVIDIPSVAVAAPLARLLVLNGMPGAEITFRTAHAAQAIAAMREAEPTLLLAAGTVLRRDQIIQAMDAGADVVVSPGFNPDNLRYCLDQGIPMIPGVNNPSQIELALSFGVNHLKFFPAEASGGVPFLQALAGPFPDVMMMPTGGIGPHNVNAYLALPTVMACGGSWMVDPASLLAADWTALAARIRLAIKQTQQGG